MIHLLIKIIYYLRIIILEIIFILKFIIFKIWILIIIILTVYHIIIIIKILFLIKWANFLNNIKKIKILIKNINY